MEVLEEAPQQVVLELEDIDHHLEVVQQLVELLNLLLKQVVIR